MPAGEVRACDVPDLAASNQGVERVKGFLYRSSPVESVQVVDVDVVRSQTFQACFAGVHQVMTAGTEIIWAVPHGEGGFGGQQNLVTAAGDRLTENFFGSSLRVNVRSVKQVDTCLKTDVDQARGFGDIGGPPSPKELALTAKCR